jgi:hypothetical protein
MSEFSYPCLLGRKLLGVSRGNAGFKVRPPSIERTWIVLGRSRLRTQLVRESGQPCCTSAEPHGFSAGNELAEAQQKRSKSDQNPEKSMIEANIIPTRFDFRGQNSEGYQIFIRRPSGHRTETPRLVARCTNFSYRSNRRRSVETALCGRRRQTRMLV